MEEPIYRLSVATQNVAYNQPTQPGFYFGSDLGNIFPEKEIIVNGDEVILDAGMEYDSFLWSVGGVNRLLKLTTKDIKAKEKTKIELTVTFRGREFKDHVFVTLNPQ